MFGSMILIAALLQSPLAQVDSSRAAFTKCLRQEVKKSLDAKMSPEDFASSLVKKCEPTRNSFRAALIAADRASGDSEATATENADLQIEDYHQNFADKFKDYSETNTAPAD
ncbi:MAG TPA: hypothetical protein VFG34_05390 [Sphingopyxis sp.]|nr:hypothetical protein [Sphingopyxis sp.]